MTSRLHRVGYGPATASAPAGQSGRAPSHRAPASRTPSGKTLPNPPALTGQLPLTDLTGEPEANDEPTGVIGAPADVLGARADLPGRATGVLEEPVASADETALLDEPDAERIGPPVVETHGLCQRYGAKTVLADIDVRLAPGQVLGVLGHNGAGKTTLVRSLCGLLKPAEGTVRVAGIDVADRPYEVRRNLGVVNQQVAVDETMTGRATLIMVGRLLGASKAEARDRAAELVEEFDLAEHADRPASQWSGGLRRRLDLACALVGRPEVLLLDEPTTGLDPISRETLWDAVDRRVADGVAVVLTTQYLAEADRLADRLLVLVQGKAVVEGTPAELKARFATRRALFDVPAELIQQVCAAWLQAGVTAGFDPFTGRLSVPLDAGTGLLDVVRFLDGMGVEPTSLDVAEPTLEDVYRELHRIDAAGQDGEHE